MGEVNYVIVVGISLFTGFLGGILGTALIVYLVGKEMRKDDPPIIRGEQNLRAPG